MPRCAHCPRASEGHCIGAEVPRVCELVDPSHPDYSPGYLEILGEGDEAAGEADPIAEPPPSYPPLLEQAGGFAKAMGKFARSGFRTVDEAEFDRRRSICLACPEYVAADDRCSKCGCSCTYKPKVASAHCPIGKW